MKRFVVIICAMCMGSVAAGRGESRTLLWKTYAEGPPQKQEKLRQARQHVQALRKNASQLTEMKDLRSNPDFIWLVRNRILGRLVVYNELEQVPEGSYLKVLLSVMNRVGGKKLWDRLPELLREVKRNESKILLLRAMGEYGAEKHLQAIREFVKNPKQKGEFVLVAGVLALSRAGNKSDLKLIKKIGPHIKRPRNEIKLMLARHRCGDEKMGQKIAHAILSRELKPRLRYQVMEYIAEEPYDRGVLATGRVADKSPNEKMRMKALQVLRRIRERIPAAVSGRNDVADKKEKPQFVGQEQQETEKSYPRVPMTKMSGKQRQQFVETVLKAWKKHVLSKDRAENKPPRSKPVQE